MGSHLLNTYHQARYSINEHDTIGGNRQSFSSESSCTQTSPDYNKKFSNGTPEFIKTEYEREKWKPEVNKIEFSSESDSDAESYVSDDPKYSCGYEMPVEEFDGQSEFIVNSDGEPYDDNEGSGHIIQIYAVHPDLDLVCSSDEENEADWCIQENENRSTPLADENVTVADKNAKTNDITVDGYDIEKVVITNVDDYFIKNQDDDKILEVKDDPVVLDVDEYFIKDDNKWKIDLFKPVENVDEYFVKSASKFTDERSNTNSATNECLTIAVECINKIESAAKTIHKTDDIIPQIESIKSFLMEDLPGSKVNFKSVQRSFSLPHSPAHFPYLDLDDGKTSLSFEDLNINDMSDFCIDTKLEKYSGDIKNKTDEPQILTDEDIKGFLITKTEEARESDDLCQQDMDFDCPVDSKIETSKNEILSVDNKKNIKSNVLDFCIEKTKELHQESKENDDFVDVESCTDTMPVLEANNLNALLEQFEATEKFNSDKVPRKINKVETKNKIGLTNGVRLQDAALQLNRNRYRQILMPTKSESVKKSASQNMHSDHDYCSPKKSFTRISSGQSLLKPEVLSSNSKILHSRHRSCKDKKVIYAISTDDEQETPTTSRKVKPSVKTQLHSNHRKKLSPIYSVSSVICKNNSANTVISNDASKTCDKVSQSSGGSIKLTIKNKKEAILKINCDDRKDSPNVNINKDKCVNSNINKSKSEKFIKPLSNINTSSNSLSDSSVKIEQKTRPVAEDFYTALFSDKKDVVVPNIEAVAKEKEAEIKENIEDTKINLECKQPPKKKLNLQEYKLRKEGASSNASSRTVSPEAIFPDIGLANISQAATKIEKSSICNYVNVTPTTNKLFDPIAEVSRKILLNSKKQKADAIRKRDDNIVMRKIPKVENLQLQPLMSEEEILKMQGKTEVPTQTSLTERTKSKDYIEIVMVSVGVNTCNTVACINKNEKEKSEEKSPDKTKSLIHFKIKKADAPIKHNVFDSTKANDEVKTKTVANAVVKDLIDEERFKDIKATIKSVAKNTDVKISSNSLFASIQDIVMKKAPQNERKSDGRKSRADSPNRRKVRTALVREYDDKIEHGEDKIILHLEKNRRKPDTSNIDVQTEPSVEFACLKIDKKTPERSRDSPMSEQKRSISKDYRRRSRSRRRRRSYSRSRSRSLDRCRNRYRKSISPYRRRWSPYRRPRHDRRERRRSITRSPAHKRMKLNSSHDKSPKSGKCKSDGSMTPPLRKPLTSESSDMSSSTSNSAQLISTNHDAKIARSYSSDREFNTPVEERRIVFVGKLESLLTKLALKSLFLRFGPIIEVTLHRKEDGARYGFVTFENARDAWTAVESSSVFPQYDVGFGGRRAFCRQQYSDLDGVEVEYSENAYHGQSQSSMRTEDMSFEQMLNDIKRKMIQRKNDKAGEEKI